MSIFSSLVVCLLCLVSLSTSSSARPMGVINNKLPYNSKGSNKLDEVEATSKTSKENATLWDDHQHKRKPQEETNTSSKTQVHHQQHDELKVALNHKEKQGHHHHEAKGSKFNKTTVSWRVPGKKKRVPQPGFNLDYAPPKVHPPVHN